MPDCRWGCTWQWGCFSLACNSLDLDIWSISHPRWQLRAWCYQVQKVRAIEWAYMACLDKGTDELLDATQLLQLRKKSRSTGCLEVLLREYEILIMDLDPKLRALSKHKERDVNDEG